MLYSENEPSRFLDDLSAGRHVALFYEDENYGGQLQFAFIKKGLLLGEHCVYTTHRYTKLLANKMSEFGIEVENFRRKGLLHIYEIPDLTCDPEGPTRAALKILKRILADSKPPRRAVFRIIPELNTVDGMRAQLNVERYCQRMGGTVFQGAILCPHSVLEIDAAKRIDWLFKLLQSHNDAVFAPKSGQGIAFKMR